MQIGKIQKISRKTCPEEKVFMSLKDLYSFGEINLSAIDISIPTLLKVIEILAIKRPSLHKYLRTNYLQGGTNKRLIVKLTLNKLNELPFGFQELDDDDIELIKNDEINEKEEEDILGINGCPTYFKMIEKNVYKRSDIVSIRQNEYYLNHNKITEITILYSTIKRKIKLFGKEFVERNKKNCSIIFNGQELELTDYLIIDEAQRDDLLEIRLKGVDKITDMRFMFYDCPDLLAVPDIHFMDTSRVTDMNSLFNKCYSLISLPNISYWNTENVKDISHMFSHCYTLKEIPDISNWDTSNVIYMRSLFSHCIKIKRLPDISEWNIQNVLDINGIFEGCKSLEYCPDISQWQINNIKDIGNLFRNCSSLKEIPYISEWDTSNVEIIKNIFNGCTSLISLPDISEWNLNNIK